MSNLTDRLEALGKSLQYGGVTAYTLSLISETIATLEANAILAKETEQELVKAKDRIAEIERALLAGGV